jgi:hypothetical protein
MGQDLLQQDKGGLLTYSAASFMSLSDDAIGTKLLGRARLSQRCALDKKTKAVSAEPLRLSSELIRIALGQDHQAERFGQGRRYLGEQVNLLCAQLYADSASGVAGQPPKGFSGGFFILGVFEVQYPCFTRSAGGNG